MKTNRRGFVTGVAAAAALPISSVAFAPDGRSALSGSYDGSVRLWDVTTEPVGWEGILADPVRIGEFYAFCQLVAFGSVVMNP